MFMDKASVKWGLLRIHKQAYGIHWFGLYTTTPKEKKKQFLEFQQKGMLLIVLLGIYPKEMKLTSTQNLHTDVHSIFSIIAKT